MMIILVLNPVMEKYTTSRFIYTLIVKLVIINIILLAHPVLQYRYLPVFLNQR